ncbi:MAG: helix-turn-helix domain-containing protein [Bacteroidaceae bacterium]|nr:helix-turn-helix domain-containing protein [Bacteroidaceae bacterium]
MKNTGLYDTSHRVLHQMSDIIEKRGVVMVDFTSSMMHNEEEYISPYSVVALCHSGYARSEYDMKPVEFHAHDISVMRPGHVVKNTATSADYSAQLIVTSAACLNTMRQQYLSHHLATQKYFDLQPCQHLNAEQYRQVCDAFRLMRTACSMEGKYREEMISSTFHTLMVLLSAWRQEMNDNQEDMEHQLLPQFNNAIIEHFHESREVGFYARLFHLSPKYFSKRIKQETGASAGEWIDRYIVLQAKSLLTRRRDLSIQQIADRLGFSEQSSLSRFFKTKVGLSPSDFREDLHISAMS